MSDKLFPKFHFQYCARTQAHLTSPRLFEKKNWELPKDSVLHYIPQSPLGDVPSMEWYGLREYRKGSRRPFIYHIFQQDQTYGKTILKSGVNVDAYKRWFRENNRRFLPFQKLEDVLPRGQQPLVVNYGFLPSRYRYVPNPYNRMFRWRNMMLTVVEQIKQLQKIRKKNHFLFIDVPETIPTRQYFMKSLEEAEATFTPELSQYFDFSKLSELKGKTTFDSSNITDTPIDESRRELLFDSTESLESFCINSGFMDGSTPSVEEWNKQVLGWFPDDESMFLSELWKLLSANHEEGILYKLGVENFHNVTIIFQAGAYYTCLNLGWLWDNIKVSGSTNGMGISESYLKILAYLNTLHESRTLVDKDYVLQTIPENIGDEEIVVSENIAEDETSDEESGEDGEEQSNNEDDSESTSRKQTIKKPKSLQNSSSLVSPISTEPLDTITALRNEMLSRHQEKEREEANRIAALSSINDKDEDVSTDVKEELDIEVPLAKVITNPEPEMDVVLQSDHPLEMGVEKESLKLLKNGLISRAEHQRNIKLAGSFKRLPALEGEGTLEDYMKIDHDAVWDYKERKLADIPDLPDQTMLNNTLVDLDQRYAKNVMKRDIVGMILNVQNAGIAVTELKSERKVTAMDDMNNFVVRFSPPSGRASTWNFPIPNIDRNGKYRVNGVKYFQRKQKTDRPIRKIKKNVVQLSTYFGKLSVERSPKSNYNYGQWIEDGITADIVGNNPTFTNVKYKDCFNSEFKLPRTYTGVMTKYMAFDVRDYSFYWDYGNWNKFFTEEQWKQTPSGMVLVGFKGKEKSLVFMNKKGDLLVNGKKDISFTDLLPKDDIRKEPVEMVTISIKGEKVPVGILLGYWYGIFDLVKELGVEPLRRKSGTRRPTLDYEHFEIRFKDEIWTFPVNNDETTLILMSFNDWHSHIKHYTVEELSERSPYAALCDDAGLSSRHLVEFHLIETMFLEPIAIDLLKQMGEPTEIKPLIRRAVEMLVDDSYPREGDTNQMLVRGYERMNGAVYRALVKGAREYYNSPMTSKNSIEINPFEVIADIQTDSSKSIVEDSNIIHNTKEKTIMTMSGTGARSKRALVKRTREFDKSDVGIRSEATVDSGDVGIIQHLTNNPSITSLRGTLQPLDPNNSPVSRVISTTSLLTPFATYDDPKRANFISIQQSHVIETVGSKTQPCRTGYEMVIAHQADDTFSFIAKGEGIVESITDEFMVVKYADKNIPKDVIEIGVRYGTVTGHTVPHNLVPKFKKGERFKAGSVLVYNSGFLQPDLWNPDQVTWKAPPLAWVTFMENTWTFEDATRIRTEFSYKLHSPTTDTRVILARFEDDIINIVQDGDEVDIDTPLCYITKGSLDGNESDFSQQSLDNLRNMGADVPRAGNAGKIGGMTVYYFGDKEDMSPSVKRLVNKYERRQREWHSIAGEDFPKSNEIIQPVRIKGSTVEINMIAIVIQINRMLDIGDGDKVVAGNQMKSVLSGHIEGMCRTTGEIIPGLGQIDTDLQFSYRSMMARIVPSVPLIGLHTTLLKSMSLEVANVFFEDK